MSCPIEFKKQCNVWRMFALVTVPTALLATCLFVHLEYSTWDTAIKVCVVLGSTTCLFWWVWVMKKIYDFAVWWGNLSSTVEQAAELLYDARAEIHAIKHSLAQNK